MSLEISTTVQCPSTCQYGSALLPSIIRDYYYYPESKVPSNGGPNYYQVFQNLPLKVSTTNQYMPLCLSTGSLHQTLEVSAVLSFSIFPKIHCGAMYILKTK